MSDANPILNNPYEEPRLHYATNLAGELDYERTLAGRRPFTPEIQSIPVRAGAQSELLKAEEVSANYGDHLVNLLRREVGLWRTASYPNTTRVTKELLTYWFLDPSRENRLFFAQREAIETAIWLNEVADRSNPGQHIRAQLSRAQSANPADPADSLPRIAFKMATGAGKTVVMGALIAYHFCNRQEYRADPRFADNFLLVAPGITIRDRLGVLRVEADGDATTIRDYYTERLLVPHSLRQSFRSLNAHLAITNFQAFQPRTLQGNKRSPFDGKIGADGAKHEALEDFGQVVRRLLPGFRAGSRLLILNDEAHHCYLPKPEDKRKAEGEDTAEENERAAVWFSGLRELSRRFKVGAIYDLSATPYYLTGSGYEPYSLFPWVVSDFGLTEAIESGLVKIPFLPTRDDTDKIGEPVLRNLYDAVRDELPKAGQRTRRARAAAEGSNDTGREPPPSIPPTLQAALDQFYRHYDEDFHRAGQITIDSSPPVFIVVCNNTSVSKEVFKFIAGYEQPRAENDPSPPDVVTGRYDLFSNYDPQSRRPHSRPPTLLIDSDALENSGQIDEGFKRVFAPELVQFKRDYARLHGAADAEAITEAEILREVVNTVGKRGTLGAFVRCVVSVSMLTEGWDANTVTHVVGIRKFGSQLLCEQVAGRALRRQRYQLAPYDPATGERLSERAAKARKRENVLWKFPPEYAHIIGVPFKLFKSGEAAQRELVETTRIIPIPDREARCEIVFPQVEGYRLEYPEGQLTVDFSRLDDYAVYANEIPRHTILENAFASEQVRLSLEDLLALRDQPILFRITKDLIRDYFSDDPGSRAFHRFPELLAIVEEWYATKVRILGAEPAWKKLLYYADPKKLVAHVAKAIVVGPAGEESVRPILNYYNPTRSTRFVHGTTTKEAYPTRHSHVSHVVIDSGWEGQAAKVLDDLADEGRIETWVKNHFLQFRIPYVDAEGESRVYLPDFIVRLRAPGGIVHHLILEITGARRDKPEKIWALRERWLPAINRTPPECGFGLWHFLEIDSEEAVADLRNTLVDWLAHLPGPEDAIADAAIRRGFGLWKDAPDDGVAYQEKLRAEWER